MTAFKQLRTAVQDKFYALSLLAKNGRGVFVAKAVQNDQVWDCYLESIPKEHNPIFRERRYYDGNYDKNFIRRLGGLMFIHDDLSVETIWDVVLPEDNYFKKVCETLSDLVKSLPNQDYFFISEHTAGQLPNTDNYDHNITWEHFYAVIDPFFVTAHVAERKGQHSENRKMLLTSLERLSLSSAEVVLDLIASNSLYRGVEFEPIVKGFVELKQQYEQVENKELWLWRKAFELGSKCRIRSTVIGTLLKDITDGVDLEIAVRAFENKVAPTNYKRTTAVVTPMMIENAKKKVQELGFDGSIYRRLATEQDVPVTERLFTATKHVATDVFGSLSDEASRTVRGLKDVTSISWADFVERVLPRAKQVEVLGTTGLKGNEVVLTAPENVSAPTMFKWDNAMAWTYLSDTADAIKERVKKAGGSVDGDVRFSLAWHSPCDLDLSCIRSGSSQMQQIYYGNKLSYGGELDVDMNAYGKFDSENPVENIVFPSIAKIPVGSYVVRVNNYNTRSPKHDHFKLQVELLGEVKTYRYNHFLAMGLHKPVVWFDVEEVQGVKQITKMVVAKEMMLESEQRSGEFLPVKFITRSPNYWGDNKVGNEHIIFAIDGFKFDMPIRGFFNEHLSNELTPHRKAFELLGNKLRIEPSETNVGGFGFSVTSKAEVIVRVTGQTKQCLKIQF